MRIAAGRYAVAQARPSRDRWLIAYADMVTLLLACFVSLYAARIDFFPPPAPVVAADDDSTLRTALERFARDAESGGALDVTADARGLAISLPEAGSFPIGRADLTPSGERVLRDLARVLAASPNAIRVEGHTDDSPTSGGLYPSNWELSTARAMRVLRLFTAAGVPAVRLSAAGYGEFRPRLANDSSAARARNRRVDIVVLRRSVEPAGDPAPGGAR